MIYTPLTKKALKISFEAHKNQLDKSGLPYVYHPFHLAEQMDDQYAVCVALLHDVIEDTPLTFDDLRREGIPEVVIEALALMTHDDDIPYLNYVYALKSNPLAKKVKLADLRHNSDLSRLDTVTEADKKRAAKYRDAIALLESPEHPNVELLNKTLAIFQKGSYEHNGKTVALQTDDRHRHAVRVWLPDELERLDHMDSTPIRRANGCAFSCANADSFTMARRIMERSDFDRKNDRVLVLNFANPVNRGGGVRRGALAQEEDLCRKSSLLLSLESEEASPYYRYNRSLKTYMGSDAMMISPSVEIIRDADGELLDRTAVAAVLTCAAPYISRGYEGLSEDDYRALLAHRIRLMLSLAAREGYTHFVLGAWGCGAFGNDAQLVARLFAREIRRFRLGEADCDSCFKRIDFAVLSRTPDSYNYRCFAQYFDKEE